MHTHWSQFVPDMSADIRISHSLSPICQPTSALVTVCPRYGSRHPHWSQFVPDMSADIRIGHSLSPICQPTSALVTVCPRYVSRHPRTLSSASSSSPGSVDPCFSRAQELCESRGGRPELPVLVVSLWCVRASWLLWTYSNTEPCFSQWGL